MKLRVLVIWEGRGGYTPQVWFPCTAKALTEHVFNDTDLADIIDLRFDVLENPPVTTFHGIKCENLTNETDFCNFVTDGANLCAEAHSTKWWDFVGCMYSVADPNGDTALDPLSWKPCSSFLSSQCDFR